MCVSTRVCACDMHACVRDCVRTCYVVCCYGNMIYHYKKQTIMFKGSFKKLMLADNDTLSVTWYLLNSGTTLFHHCVSCHEYLSI